MIVRPRHSAFLIPGAALTAVAVLTTMAGFGTQAAASTTTPSAVLSADTYVNSATPGAVYGTATTLQADAKSASAQVSYLKFEVQGLTAAPAHATLRFYSRSRGQTPTSVYATGNAWDETATSFANRPALGARLGATGVLSAGSWVQADVTAAVRGNGTVSFALATTATAARVLDSREGANPPQLVLTPAASVPTATSSAPSSPATSSTPTAAPTTPTPAPTTPAPAGAPTKILTIVEENHSLAQMSASMPYLYSLAQRYAYATDYTGVTHPSEPNYLAIAGGSTFGDTADHNPAYQVSGHSIFGQAIAAGRTAKLYAESMTSNCQQSNGGSYAVKHNPWASFRDERAQCASFDVPLGTTAGGALASDIANGTLPNAGMIVPNLCNDAHDCSLSVANGWLQAWLPKILSGPDFTSGRLAVIVTADEDDRNSGNKVLTVALHPGLDGRHLVVSTPLTHYSLTGLYDTVLRTTPLVGAGSAANMAAAFRIS